MQIHVPLMHMSFRPVHGCFRPEVQAIFEKYVPGNTRRLVKDDAISMLMSEFIIERKWAEQFFTHFDADSNDVLSLWEFQHFYHVVGNRCVP